MPMDKIDKEQRERFERTRMLKRIRANTIIGLIGFRDHFCSHPGRHSWDLCGHPLYYWSFKTALESKYIQKIIVYTETEEALRVAKEMSPKFIPIKRPLKFCKEFAYEIIDDLKTPDSRIIVMAEAEYIQKEINKATGKIKFITVNISVPHCLVTSKSLDRLIEAYFLDPFASRAVLICKSPQVLFFKDPTTKYLIAMYPLGEWGRRQQGFQMYHGTGDLIAEYQIWGKGEIVGVKVPFEESIDVHDEEDLRIARIFMRDRLEKEK